MTPFTVALAVALCACGPSREERQRAAEQAAAALRTSLAAERPPAFGSARSGQRDQHVWKEARRFYEANGHQLVWSDGRRPLASMDALVEAIAGADHHGLNPADYDVAALKSARDAFDPARAPDIDLRFTTAYLRYGADLARGTADPEDVDPKWHSAPREVDLAGSLANAVRDERIKESLDALAPQLPQYRGLQHQLARYREIAARGGWQPVPDSLALNVGAQHPGVAALRQRLAATGDLSGGDPQAAVVDEPLLEAVKRAQARHGLKADGKYTREFAAALNVPVETRLRQIRMNMDRWRWMPADLGDRYLIVNIPAFRLDAIENGKSVLGMRVVTGRREDPTPVLADRMTYLVFSPYWNIPPEILAKETLPAIAKDPSYLERNNIEVVKGAEGEPVPVDASDIDWDDQERLKGLRFRQRPGPKNSLGLVKFIFPNNFNVYLHDTPADALFERVERDFSHGCVRLEFPEQLAQYLLRDQPQWNERTIAEAMHAGVEKIVKLKEPVPVYLVYFTAWEEGGNVQFRDDVYGHDREQVAATAKGR